MDKGLRERLEHVKETPFVRCSYTEAVDILLKSGKTFEMCIRDSGNFFYRFKTSFFIYEKVAFSPFSASIYNRVSNLSLIHI